MQFDSIRVLGGNFNVYDVRKTVRLAQHTLTIALVPHVIVVALVSARAPCVVLPADWFGKHSGIRHAVHDASASYAVCHICT